MLNLESSTLEAILHIFSQNIFNTTDIILAKRRVTKTNQRHVIWRDYGTVTSLVLTC